MAEVAEVLMLLMPEVAAALRDTLAMEAMALVQLQTLPVTALEEAAAEALEAPSFLAVAAV
jgi:hypothetical protein